MTQVGAAPRLSRWGFPVLVGLLTFAVFWPALRGGFLNWDDDVNFLTNPHYRGLGWANLCWMFTNLRMGPYQPLCWLSLGLDYLVWGMNPLGYHLTNVLLHAANAALFYELARWLYTHPAEPAPPGRSLSPCAAAALAAVLFAVHPLRVESVAWVTERKDVLTGFFYLWAVYAYLRQSEAPVGCGRRWRVLCWGAFTLALLSRMIVITLPVIFLILDVYPLHRLPADPRRWFAPGQRRVWLEKLLFLVPALPIALVGYLGQRQAKAIFVESFPAHCAKAFFRLAFFLWKTLWPVGLSPYESPVPFDPFAWPWLLSAAVVGLVTLAVALLRRRWPAGLAAWACYAAALAPVLGIVSFGAQLVADRYSYLSCLPWPLLAAAGLGWSWQRAGVYGRRLLGLGAALALAALSILTWRQAGFWHDSKTLWEHTLAVRPRTCLAHNNLGNVLAGEGRTNEAVAQYIEALRIDPSYAEAHYNLAVALAGQGRLAEAEAYYDEAMRRKPDNAELHNNLGVVLAGQDRLDEAVAHYREALRLQPDYADAHNNWGRILAAQGRLEEAIAHYREAMTLRPDSPVVRVNLGLVLAGQGKRDEAVAQFQEALSLKPDYLDAYINYGVALVRQGRLEEARRAWLEALRINPEFEPARRNLGILQRKMGKR